LDWERVMRRVGGGGSTVTSVLGAEVAGLGSSGTAFAASSSMACTTPSLMK
jgi:hypothetical protein